MEATVGRILHYHPTPEDPVHGTDMVLAAVVSAVKKDGSVNLMVIEPSGQATFGRSNVPIVEGSSPELTGYAEWPKIIAPSVPREPEAKARKK